MTEDTPATNGNTSGEGEVKTLWIGDLVRVGENKETHTTSSRITLIFFLDMAQVFATLFFLFFSFAHVASDACLRVRHRRALSRSLPRAVILVIQSSGSIACLSLASAVFSPPSSSTYPSTRCLPSDVVTSFSLVTPQNRVTGWRSRTSTVASPTSVRFFFPFIFPPFSTNDLSSFLPFRRDPSFLPPLSRPRRHVRPRRRVHAMERSARVHQHQTRSSI